MRGTTVLCLLLVAGCQGPKGDQGPPGPQGPSGTGPASAGDGAIAGDGGAPVVTTGATWCDGDGQTLWSATKNGDSSFVTNCFAYYSAMRLLTMQSTTNPFGCYSGNCPTDTKYFSFPGPACCRFEKPRCSLRVLGMPQFSGDDYENDAPDCGFDLGECTNQITVAYAGAVPRNGDQMSIDLPFPANTPLGQPLRYEQLVLPAGCDISPPSVIAVVGGKKCDQWSGTVTLKSVGPSPGEFSVDLGCTVPGVTITLSGDFTSNI